MSEGQASNPPSPRSLALITFGAAAVATMLTVLVILPAEFGKDPTGFGKLSGLKTLAGEGVSTGPAAHFYDAAYRSDSFEIPFAAVGDKSGSELEFKVRMKAGATLIYSWNAEGAENDGFFFDLHSESAPGEAEKLVEFKQATGTGSHGALVAPMNGIHGWYWQNKSASPVRVHLKLSGFYELISPNESGNKAGIIPTGTAQN